MFDNPQTRSWPLSHLPAQQILPSAPFPGSPPHPPWLKPKFFPTRGFVAVSEPTFFHSPVVNPPNVLKNRTTPELPACRLIVSRPNPHGHEPPFFSTPPNPHKLQTLQPPPRSKPIPFDSNSASIEPTQFPHPEQFSPLPPSAPPLRPPPPPRLWAQARM